MPYDRPRLEPGLHRPRYYPHPLQRTQARAQRLLELSTNERMCNVEYDQQNGSGVVCGFGSRVNPNGPERIQKVANQCATQLAERADRTDQSRVYQQNEHRNTSKVPILVHIDNQNSNNYDIELVKYNINDNQNLPYYKIKGMIIKDSGETLSEGYITLQLQIGGSSDPGFFIDIYYQNKTKFAGIYQRIFDDGGVGVGIVEPWLGGKVFLVNGIAYICVRIIASDTT